MPRPAGMPLPGPPCTGKVKAGVSGAEHSHDKGCHSVLSGKTHAVTPGLTCPPCPVSARMWSAGGGPSMVIDTTSSPRSSRSPSTRRSSFCKTKNQTARLSSQGPRYFEQPSEHTHQCPHLLLALLGWQLAELLGIAKHQVHMPIKRHEPESKIHANWGSGPAHAGGCQREGSGSHRAGCRLLDTPLTSQQSAGCPPTSPACLQRREPSRGARSCRVAGSEGPALINAPMWAYGS